MGTTSVSSAPRTHHTRTSESSRAAPTTSTPRASPPRSTGHTDASTFEAGPAARAEARTRLEGTLARSGVEASVSRSITRRIDRLPEADAARERALVARAASGPNPARAVRAYDEVSRIAGESAEATRRLTPEIRESLVRGVSESRSSDPTGHEGVLGVHQASTAARALVDMPADRYDQVSGLLSRAGSGHAASPQADAQAERALILSSVAARSRSLTHSGEAGDRALDEVRGFANEVRGLPREELIRTTSALDLDTRSTSATRTDETGFGATGDTTGTNDGLVQRFTDSCAPTGAQLERAEHDPVYARALHREGVSSSSTTGALAEEQRETLEAGHGRAVSRELGPRAREAVEHLRTAVADSDLSPEARTRLRDYVSGRPLDTTALAGVACDLDRLRATHTGSPSPEDLRAIRALATAPRGEGMDAERALEHIAGGNWASHDSASSGLSARQTGDIARRLEAGHDVGLRISDRADTGGHFLMLTDVRGEGADRSFLVSDPWSGRTTWMPESDLRSHSTPGFDREFGVGWDRVSTYYTARSE
jgi:hypothetical protein